MCTTISIKRNGYYMCKSMDFKEKYNYTFVYFPENSPYEEDIFGNILRSKYKMMGTTFKGFDQFIDGINENGLMGSTNSFKNEVSFEKNPDNSLLNITSTKLLNVLLANCRDIDEVIIFCKDIRIFNKSIINKKNFSRHYHYMLTDRFGKTVILEFVNGIINIYGDNYNIMTNNPNYPRQCEILNKFLKKEENRNKIIERKDFISSSRRFINAYMTLNNLDVNNDKYDFYSILENFAVYKDDYKNLNENNTITLYHSILDSENKKYTLKFLNSKVENQYTFEDFKNCKRKIIYDLKK